MKSLLYLILFLNFVTIYAQNFEIQLESPKKDPIIFSNQYIPEVDSTYILGPGDFFEIIMNDLSVPYQVGPEGLLSISGIKPVNVQNQTLVEAKKKIISQLQIEYPQTSIEVNLFRVRKINVTILGYVQRPSDVKVDNKTSILELIHQAQGFEKLADKKNVLHIRRGDTTVVDFHRLLKEGDHSLNIKLADGDFVVVPKMNMSGDLIYYVVDGDYFPIPLESPNKSLYYYIDQLDFLQTPNVKSLLIRNKTGLREYTHEQAKSVFPIKEDTIDVKLSYTDVFVGGMVKVSGPQSFNPDYRPIEYLFNAGTSIMADQLDRVRVVRRNGTFEYIDPIKGAIYPGDYIELDMSGLDYAVKWTPIFTAILSFTTIVWSIYYNTVWLPNSQ